VIDHLIEAHGRRRIAFLRGTATHEGAQERYRAYTESLSDHGLPFDPLLVPLEFWKTERRRTRLVLALYFQTENIGFIMFDLQRSEDIAHCEALCRQISGARKGAALYSAKGKGRNRVEFLR
jgi:hypothetical protein